MSGANGLLLDSVVTKLCDLCV